MNQFNYLPPELIENIFKKLEFNDLINLRIVDKRFKLISEQIEIKKLYISDHRDCSNFKWFYRNDLFDLNEENIIKISKFINFKSIFKNLKRLLIWTSDDFNISILNEFKLLEQLDMNINKINDNYKLSLDNLKIARIDTNFPEFKFKLDTVKLFAFTSFNDLDNFIFNYPDKILYYEKYYDDNYIIFKNLEYLKLIRAFKLDKDILSKFINLKIIDFNISVRIGEIEFNNLKNDINFIINQKENLKRFEFQICLNGVQLINLDKIHQLKWSVNWEGEFATNILEFQINNFNLLKDNCCVEEEELNYCDLIKLIQIIPSSFCNKFSNIYKLIANNHIHNEDQFIKFLNDLPFLSNLKLIDCGLSRSFYNKFINLTYSNSLNLRVLVIEEKIDLEIDFNFILNLRRLKLIRTNQKLNSHFILKLFQINNYIKLLEFKLNEKNYIRVRKYFNCFGIESFYYSNNNSEKSTNFLIKNSDLNKLIKEFTKSIV